MNYPQLLANAALDADTNDAGQTVSSTVQKAVLLVVWASEGNVTTYRAIADRCGCTIATVRHAIASLTRRGFVARSAHGRGQQAMMKVIPSALVPITSANSLKRGRKKRGGNLRTRVRGQGQGRPRK